MKRLLTMALALTLALALCAPASAAAIDGLGIMGPYAKLTKEDYRISAYTVYLKELFNDGGKGRITHVGIADVNRDRLPELFYIFKEKTGGSTFHFCGFEDEEVYEFDIDVNYIGYGPGALSLKRYRRVGSSSHIWILQSTGKNAQKRKETLHNVFTRSDTSLENEMKLRRTWTGKNKNIRYTVDEMETTKDVYNAALNELLYQKYVWADPSPIKNQGAIRKVSSPKTWLGVRNALTVSAKAWSNLPTSK